MHQVLFTVGSIRIHSYGLAMSVAFAVALSVAYRRLIRRGFSIDDALNLFIIIMVSAVAGSRLLFVIVNPSGFIEDPLLIFRLDRGGLVYFGGFLGAVVSVAAYFLVRRLPLLTGLDALAAALPLGHAIGRVGCLLNGCCHGVTCAPGEAGVIVQAVDMVPRIPTQALSTGSNILVFLGLLWVERGRGRAGWTTAAYLLTYPIARYSIEILRGDDRGTLVLGMTVSQAISAGTFAIGLLLAVWLLRAGPGEETMAAESSEQREIHDQARIRDGV